jgi:D-alanyl-D-alanine carboxypeptidase (penicillin-binding protein 5/6)
MPWPLAALALAGMTAILVLQLGGSAPEPTLRLAAARSTIVPGTAPALPWPATGESALSVPEAGVAVASGPEQPVPVASLTKMMTAYVVLRDHPVGPAAPGPTVVMTQTDVRDAAADAAGGDTSVPVTAGEALSERQLLDGLLVHSAADFADALARWDAGSLAAFVGKMNAAAVALGLRQTHYVDPNGIDPGDVSTAADQLRVAGAGLAIPAFAAVVAQPAVVEPGAGLLSNYVPAVGTDGVVGVKSGFTQAANACVVLAAERQVQGRQVLVLAAVTGRQGVNAIGAADTDALRLIDTAAGALQVRTLVPAGQRAATVWAPWVDRSAVGVTDAGVTTVVWPGQRWQVTVEAARDAGGVRPGEQIATVVASDGSTRYGVPVVATGSLPSVPTGWRLVHS